MLTQPHPPVAGVCERHGRVPLDLVVGPVAPRPHRESGTCAGRRRSPGANRGQDL